MKQLKDYLHLYLGCECLIGDNPEIQYVRMVNETGLSICTGTNSKDIPMWYKTAHSKLLLRPLSDMTEQEAKESRKMYDTMNGQEKLLGEIEGERTRYLLSKHFDLFNLIPEGLAIDKTLTPTP